MTDELTLKAWAINASRNPYDEHQKAHADATLKLIEERDALRFELAVARERLGPAGYKIIQEVTKLRDALERGRKQLEHINNYWLETLTSDVISADGKYQVKHAIEHAITELNIE